VFGRPAQRFMTLKPKRTQFNATNAVPNHNVIPVDKIPIIIIIVATLDIYNRRESTVQEILLSCTDQQCSVTRTA